MDSVCWGDVMYMGRTCGACANGSGVKRIFCFFRIDLPIFRGMIRRKVCLGGEQMVLIAWLACHMDSEIAAVE